MQVKHNGYTIDTLAIVTGDHLLTAMAQIDFYDQETLSWLHDWTERMIQSHAREDLALERAVFVAFNALVCSRLDQDGAP